MALKVDRQIWIINDEDPEKIGQGFETCVVLMKRSKHNRLMTETKGTTQIDNLRPSEKRKIKRAEKHFQSINVGYTVLEKPEDITLISSDNELSINLRYVGDGTTPPISIGATALTKSDTGKNTLERTHN